MLQLDCKVKIFRERTYPQIIGLGFTFIKLAVVYRKVGKLQLQLQLDFYEILHLNYNAVNLYLYVVKVN